jgi:electron transport complex protein RnfD
MSQLLTVSASPHILGKRTVSSLYMDWVIAMIPAVAAAVYYFHAAALINILLAVAATVGFEWAICTVFKTPNRLNDLHAVVMGLMLGLLMPAGAPFWIPIMGGLFVSGLAKAIFGGLGAYPMNPVLIAWACLSISWPTHMNAFWETSLAAKGALQAAQTPLMLLKTSPEALKDMSLMALWCGYVPGAVGATSTWAILLGGIYLLIRRVISWHIPLGVILGTLILSLFAASLDSNVAKLGWDTLTLTAFHLGAGGLMLGAFFLAPEHVSSPVTCKGMLIYGLGVGALSVIIRQWGANTEGVYFAILFMSLTTPLLDRLRPKVLGKAGD